MDSKLLSPEDRHDIERSFDAIDDEKIGKIDVDRLYVLFLGLGYSTNHPHVSKVDLAAYVPQFRHDAVDLDDVLRIFSCFSRSHESELSNLYDLICNGKKSISPSDFVLLATEMGDSLTEEDATKMMGEKKFWTLEDLREALK